MNKKLGFKNMSASIALGEDLIIPYLDSQVFADIDDKTGELYILVKHKKDPAKSVKLFFKENDPIIEEIKDETIK